jgi:hypothetical protein
MKIKLITKDHEQTLAFRDKKFLKICSDFGIRFVDRSEDIRIIHTSGANVKKDPTIIKQGPVIIVEKFDSANIGHRKEIVSDNVLALWKISKFRDDKTNFLPKYKGRYHSDIIMQNHPDRNNSNIKINDPIEESHLNKIQLPNSYAHYKCTLRTLRNKVDVHETRSWDVHFCGTIKYDACMVDSPISIHRNLCLNKLKSIKGMKSLVRAGRPMQKDKYIQSLFSSKIVVSPWGCGEVCFRDYEALAAGCVLVKPDTSFVETWPDIFINGGTYFPCKPDFSNLESVLNDILENWKKLKDFRIENRKLVEKGSRSVSVAKRFKMLLEKATGERIV